MDFWLGFFIGALIAGLFWWSESSSHKVTKGVLKETIKQKDLYFNKMKLWEKMFKNRGK